MAKSNRPSNARSAQKVSRAARLAALPKRLWTFLGEVVVELQKVSWPSRVQMRAFSIVTLVMVTVVTALIFGMDLGLRKAVFWLLEWGT